MKALSPSVVVGRRNALTGEARATRVRQLATPSWLSTRTTPGRRARSRGSRDHRQDGVINLEPATAAGSCRFFSLALRAVWR